MGKFSDAITHFLDDYRSADQAGDRERLLLLFAPAFLAGDVNGTQAVTREQFAMGLDLRARTFAAQGLVGSQLLAHEHRSFGPVLAMLSTTWSLDFVRLGGQPVSVVTESDFLLHVTAGAVQVIAYIARQDVGAAISEALS